jgi:hypothetical protein
MEKRIKRLEIAVITLSIMFVISIFVSIYAVTQIRLVAAKIPDYKEIKEDLKTLKSVYVYGSTKVDSMHVKEKIVKGYDYTVEKTGEFIDFLKKQKDKRK